MMNSTHRAPSQKQIEFVQRLLVEKDLTGTKYLGWTPDWNKATAAATSSVIDYLLTLPKAQATSTDEPQAGVYTDGVQMIRVYLGQNSGQMLAKSVRVERALDAVSAEYVYDYLGKAVRFITEKFHRMSLDEIGKLGHATGSCAHCGRRLDDPESVDLGIGPVCAQRY